MGVHNPIRTSRSLLGFCVTLLVIVSSCYCEQNVLKSSSTVQVVGVATCSDCTQSNLLSTHALSGLRVTIDCKVSDQKGEFKTRGVSKLDKDGKFKVTLPSEIVKDDGELKEECFAQLHSASNAPCPTHQGLEASKLILKSKDQQTGKHTFSPNGQISISPITCQSAFFWPHYKFPPMPKFPPHPWFKKTHPWFKKPIPKFKLPNFPPLPPKVLPPIYKHPWFKKPLPPPTPVYVPTPKVNPPPTPVYVPTPKANPPPTPVYVPTPKVNPPPVYKKKPCPPPVPVHVPTPKVNPPPVPVHVPTPKVNPPPVYKKKPCPPPVPVHVPTPKVNPPPTPVYVPTPKVNPPPVPVYKEPLPPPTPIYKPHPPIYTIPKIPPFFKKPCPPLPPFPKIPPKLLHPFPKIHKKFFHHPIPKIPKKFFKHPKFGKWPPMPPFTSHP